MDIMSGGATPPGPQAASKAVAADPSVLDFNQGRSQAPLLAATDRQRPKLDSHLDALREFERTLVAPAGGMNITIPPAPPVVFG